MAAVLALAVALPAAAAARDGAPPRDDRERRLRERTADAAVEKRIDSLLAAMTLEEKVGQMTMVNVVEDVPDEGKPYPPGFPTLRPARLDEVLGRHQVGFLMSDLALDAPTWARFVGGLQREALARSRLRIPMTRARATTARRPPSRTRSSTSSSCRPSGPRSTPASASSRRTAAR
jgi:hypothetical protein